MSTLEGYANTAMCHKSSLIKSEYYNPDHLFVSVGERVEE